MSLNLDARQRAMLQEMGVTVWTRAETAALQAPAAPPPAAAAVPLPATAPLPAAPAMAQPISAPAARAHTAPAPAAPAAHAGLGAPGAAPALRLHAPQLLYPTADPAQTPPGLGAGWLIVTEGIAAADPLGGDAGKLLDNMLRAMQLHRHPRVFVTALERTAPGARTAEGAAAPADVAAALAEVVTTLQPALVLVLGHVAARAALGRTEPLGRLRAVPHTVAGRPAVVTYDPAFLLRSQDAKAATWADLCRALALVRKAEGGASHAG
ncbi:uracil-DNA glycosylase family protein [Acidovorax temperans]